MKSGSSVVRMTCVLI